MSERYDVEYVDFQGKQYRRIVREGKDVNPREAVNTLNSQAARIAALVAEVEQMRQRAERAESLVSHLRSQWAGTLSARYEDEDIYSRESAIARAEAVIAHALREWRADQAGGEGTT